MVPSVKDPEEPEKAPSRADGFETNLAEEDPFEQILLDVPAIEIDVSSMKMAAFIDDTFFFGYTPARRL